MKKYIVVSVFRKRGGSSIRFETLSVTSVIEAKTRKQALRMAEHEAISMHPHTTWIRIGFDAMEYDEFKED